MSQTLTPARDDARIDVAELWRAISMGMIARGHWDAGRRMLEALRDAPYADADLQASAALALVARGDWRAALRHVETEVLRERPSHAFGLLVKAVCERTLQRPGWRQAAEAVLRSDPTPSIRDAAQALLRD